MLSLARKSKQVLISLATLNNKKRPEHCSAALWIQMAFAVFRTGHLRDNAEVLADTRTIFIDIATPVPAQKNTAHLLRAAPDIIFVPLGNGDEFGRADCFPGKGQLLERISLREYHEMVSRAGYEQRSGILLFQNIRKIFQKPVIGPAIPDSQSDAAGRIASPFITARQICHNSSFLKKISSSCLLERH